MVNQSILIGVGIVAGAGAYIYQRVRNGAKRAVIAVTNGATAFGKIADAEGKILSAKAKAAEQKEAALNVHKDIDEVHNILG